MDYIDAKIKRATSGKAPCKICPKNSNCDRPDICEYWNMFVKAMKNGK